MHLIHRSFNKHLALVENRNRAGDLSHKFHIVFNNNNRVIHRQAFEKLPRLNRLFIRHTSSGFVNQKKFWILQNNHRNLQPLFLPVRKRIGNRMQMIGQPRLLCNSLDAVAIFIRQTRNKRKENCAVSLKCQHQILVHRKRSKNRRRLKLPPNTRFDNRIFAHLGEIELFKTRTAAIRSGLPT